MAREVVRDSPFSAVENGAAVSRNFKTWSSALCGPEHRGAQHSHWLADEQLFVQFWRKDARQMARLRTALVGDNFAVEINEPADPTFHNGTSTIGRGPDGRLYLLRWGRLTNASGARIEESTFAAASGRVGVRLRFRRGDSTRIFHIVACLNEAPEQIRHRTARFVADCELARDWPSLSSEAREQSVILRKIEESGVGYEVGERPAMPPQWIAQLHAAVSTQLLERLRRDGRDLGAILPTSRFCIDGAFQTKSGPLLLEIKTSASASDVHHGVGQLMLYRNIFPQFNFYRPVLLLRGQPSPILAQAVEKCGITLMQYEATGAKNPEVQFSPDFLALCDLAPEVARAKPKR